ncbi:MAG: histidinol-phosphate transaminase [Candidatus Omnitrophota bacterium]|nr:histidinol-phosphate transaminase [Candidatus Omnitrophota bacterium]
MRKIAREEIFKVNPYVPGKPIEEVQRELGLKEVIKLASNESPLPPSPKVIKAIIRAAKDLNRYPEGSCYYLRQKLARKLGVKESQLVFGNGSDELIVMAIRAFVYPGEEVIVAKPTFLIYEIAATIAGARVVTVPMKNFRYDLKAMKAKVTPKTKIIYIANPDNPTGSYVNKEEVAEFLKGLSRKIIVYFDEAYYELVDKKDYPETLPLLKKNKNLIITRTFSKAYSLAGLRVGYGIATEETIDCLNRVREPFNINTLAQVAALASLDDNSHLARLRKILKQGKAYLIKNFKQMGIDFVPSATNFILLKLDRDGTAITNRLMRRGVIVRNMIGWGLKDCIRVTIGTREENKKFINALRRIL